VEAVVLTRALVQTLHPQAVVELVMDEQAESAAVEPQIPEAAAETAAQR
tara:strand:+ start:226 stop:372 length:147 start_codon:yes stop_codon:yes gene_type:complete